MRYHHQRLDRRPWDTGLEPSGPLWRHGRAWLSQGKSTLGWEWSVLQYNPALLRVAVDPERVCLRFSIPFLLFFSISLLPAWGSWLHRLLSKPEGGRDLGVSFHGGGMWVDLWCNSMSSTSRGSFWKPERRRFSVHPLDIIFGDTQYDSQERQRCSVLVPMPERAYKGQCVMTLRTRTRPRFPWWPLTTALLCSDIDLEGDPIPYPGKGENAWDCAQDALRSFHCPADSPSDGVSQVVKSVLRTRERRGGYAWKPAT